MSSSKPPSRDPEKGGKSMNRFDAVKMVRWSARLLAACAFLFWGALFVEHTSEWFAHPFQELPPLNVILRHGCHFLMLVGLLVGWRWEGIGGAMTLIFSVLFFVGVGAPQFLVSTVIPGILYLVSWHLSQRVAQQAV
jgi:hypothetical protein